MMLLTVRRIIFVNVLSVHKGCGGNGSGGGWRVIVVVVVVMVVDHDDCSWASISGCKSLLFYDSGDDDDFVFSVGAWWSVNDDRSIIMLAVSYEEAKENEIMKKTKLGEIFSLCQQTCSPGLCYIIIRIIIK